MEVDILKISSQAVEIKSEDIESDLENAEQTQQSSLKTEEFQEILSQKINKCVDAIEIKPEDIEPGPENLEEPQKFTLKTQESLKIINLCLGDTHCRTSSQSVGCGVIQDTHKIKEFQYMCNAVIDDLQLENIHKNTHEENSKMDKPNKVEQKNRTSCHSVGCGNIQDTHKNKEFQYMCNAVIDHLQLENIHKNTHEENSKIDKPNKVEQKTRTSSHSVSCGNIQDIHKNKEFEYMCNTVINGAQLERANRWGQKTNSNVRTHITNVPSELKETTNAAIHTIHFTDGSTEQGKTDSIKQNKYFFDGEIHEKEVIIEVAGFRCSHCQYLNFSHKMMKHHIRVNHRDPSLARGKKSLPKQCPHCPKKITKLNQHIITCHKKHLISDYLFCGHCDYKTPNKQVLQSHITAKHIEVNPSELHKCDECGKTFKSRFQLKKHTRLTHHPETAEWMKCSYCEFSTKFRDGLKRHTFLHKNPKEGFTCTKCDFIAKDWREITKHKKMEHQEWGQCHLCPYKTKNRTSLSLHLIHHQDKKKEEDLIYKCGKCDYKTYRRYNLTIHNLKHKKPEEKEMFRCYHCDFKASRKDNLKTHIFKHGIYKNILKCFICDFKTSSQFELKKHLDMHAGNQENEDKESVVQKSTGEKRLMDKSKDEKNEGEGKRKRYGNKKKIDTTESTVTKNGENSVGNKKKIGNDLKVIGNSLKKVKKPGKRKRK